MCTVLFVFLGVKTVLCCCYIPCPSVFGRGLMKEYFFLMQSDSSTNITQINLIYLDLLQLMKQSLFLPFYFGFLFIILFFILFLLFSCPQSLNDNV